ncbi:hypothetical protein SUGI_0079370 [Cryptomeria japonica]|nr:hypothetical protein SUGI_0079370 [Cryptomeria japonica]
MDAFLLRYQAERDYKALKTGRRHFQPVKGDDHSLHDKCRPKLFECPACIKDRFKQSLYSRNLATNPKNLAEHPKNPCQSIYSATDKHFERLMTQARFGYLVNVLHDSLSDSREKIVENCNKWAAEFEEEKISKAIGIAWKALAVMEEAENLRTKSNAGDSATAQPSCDCEEIKSEV